MQLTAQHFGDMVLVHHMLKYNAHVEVNEKYILMAVGVAKTERQGERFSQFTISLRVYAFKSKMITWMSNIS